MGTSCDMCNTRPARLTPVQLLHKLSIRGVQGSEKLLRVIKVGFLSSVVWTHCGLLMGRTQLPTTSPPTPSNLVSLLGRMTRLGADPSSVRRRANYPPFAVPAHAARNAFYRRLRRRHGARVSRRGACGKATHTQRGQLCGSVCRPEDLHQRLLAVGFGCVREILLRHGTSGEELCCMAERADKQEEIWDIV